MKSFKTFLTERMQKNDIIDLYIIMTMPEPAEEDNKYNAQQILQNSKANIIKEIETILLKELRHFSSQSKYEMLYIKPDSQYSAWAKNLGKNIFGIDMPYKILDKKLEKTASVLQKKLGDEEYEKDNEITIAELAQLTGLPWTIDAVVNAFNKMPWDGGYGGRSWATIAEQAKKLIQSSPVDLVKNIDRFVDYVHNTGPVLTKFKGSNEGWLLYLLDLKQHTKNIRELIPYASYEVRKLFGDIMWRQFMMEQGFPGAEDVNNTSMIKKFVKNYLKKGAQTTVTQRAAAVIYALNKQPYETVKNIIQSLDPNERKRLDLLTIEDIEEMRESGIDKNELNKYAETYVNIVADEYIDKFKKEAKDIIKMENYHAQFKKLYSFTYNMEDEIYDIILSVGLNEENIIERITNNIINILKLYDKYGAKQMLTRAKAILKTNDNLYKDVYILDQIIKKYV